MHFPLELLVQVNLHRFHQNHANGLDLKRGKNMDC